MTSAAINQICSASFNGKLPPAKREGSGASRCFFSRWMEEEMRANKGGLSLSLIYIVFPGGTSGKKKTKKKTHLPVQET